MSPYINWKRRWLLASHESEGVFHIAQINRVPRRAVDSLDGGNNEKNLGIMKAAGI